MATKELIIIKQLCANYNIEESFINKLISIGLLEVTTIEESQYIHQDCLTDLEKIIRLHNELYINPEGIDVVLNLLNKIESLQKEVNLLKDRLYFYDN